MTETKPYIPNETSITLTEIVDGVERTITISKNIIDMNIHEILNGIIEPALRGFGYAEQTIEDVLNHDRFYEGKD